MVLFSETCLLGVQSQRSGRERGQGDTPRRGDSCGEAPPLLPTLLCPRGPADPVPTSCHPLGPRALVAPLSLTGVVKLMNFTAPPPKMHTCPQSSFVGRFRGSSQTRNAGPRAALGTSPHPQSDLSLCAGDALMRVSGRGSFWGPGQSVRLLTTRPGGPEAWCHRPASVTPDCPRPGAGCGQALPTQGPHSGWHLEWNGGTPQMQMDTYTARAGWG